MKTRPGRAGGLTRLARALGLDRNPLRRATDRAEAWIRAGLLGVFLVAGPIAALDAGHWAYHAGSTVARGRSLRLTVSGCQLPGRPRPSLAGSGSSQAAGPAPGWRAPAPPPALV